MVERTLDWVSRHDPRSRNYPVRAVIGAVRPRDRNKQWSVGPVLDQGQEGQCVTFAWAGELLATPVRVDFTRVRADIPRDATQFARTAYAEAQKIDEWPGQDYSGTSVLAGAKVLTKYGLLKEYRWCFTTNDVVDAILTKGPVVLGIPWFSGMYSAPGGVLRVTGTIVGGHAILAVGRRLNVPELGGRNGITLLNSWGPGWGRNGLAVIAEDDLAHLFADQGEACVPVRRSFGR